MRLATPLLGLNLYPIVNPVGEKSTPWAFPKGAGIIADGPAEVKPADRHPNGLFSLSSGRFRRWRRRGGRGDRDIQSCSGVHRAWAPAGGCCGGRALSGGLGAGLLVIRLKHQ